MLRGATYAAALLVAALGAQGGSAAKPQVGQPAPPFTLKLVNGEVVDLASLRGQVVVLNFWATWCVPCRRELPLLDALYRLRGEYGLRIYAVTTEGSVPLHRLKPVMDVVSFPFVRSLRGPYDKLGAVPTNYVIDRAGIVRYAKAGAFDLDDMNEIIIPLMQEAAPAR